MLHAVKVSWSNIAQRGNNVATMGNCVANPSSFNLSGSHASILIAFATILSISLLGGWFLCRLYGKSK